MATQTLQIDLTGRDGLMDNFFGDYDINNAATPATNLVGQPERRYGNATSGMMASGAYNPFKRVGYLSPADKSYTTVTQASGSIGKQSCSIYDVVNNDLYFLEADVISSGINLLKADGFEDDVIAIDRNMSGSYGTDLEIYSIYGERCLFSVIRSSTATRLHVKNLLYDTTTETFTADAGTDVITLTKSNTNYTIVDNMIVAFTTSNTLPAGMGTGLYYVINASDSGTSATFKISNSLGGAAVNITSTGTGTHYLSPFKDSASLYFVSTFDLSTNGNAKLLKSGDGFMYILDANNIHRFDGTVIGGVRGTIYQNILTAPSFTRFTGGIDHKSNMYIIVHQNTSLGVGNNSGYKVNTECGVYVWNRQSSFFNSSQFIPIVGVREINRVWVNERDEVMLMATDSNDYGVLYKFNGTSFIKVKKLPKSGFVIFDDSLYVTSYGTCWLAKDGFLYCWGVAPHGTKPGLFIIGDVNSSTASFNIASGAALYGSTTSSYPESVYLSYRDSATYKMSRFYTNHNGGTTGVTMYNHTGSISTPVIFLPKMSTVHHMDIFFPTASTSGTTYAGSIKFYKNQQSTSFMTKYVTRDDLAKGYLSVEINLPFINSIQLRFEYFNDVNTVPSGSTPTSGTLDFAPSYATLTFTPTTTIK